MLRRRKRDEEGGLDGRGGGMGRATERDGMLEGTNTTKLNPRKRCKEARTDDQTHSTHAKKSIAS
jgi:hypothetical protein